MDSLLQSWLQGRCPLAGLPSAPALGVLIAYVALLGVLGALLPAKYLEGAKLSDGTKIIYNCNGFMVLLSMLLLFGLSSFLGILSPTALADMGGEIFATTLVCVLLTSTVLYFVGRFSKSKSSSFRPHLTGNFLKDWWLGVQLNPKFLGMDLKFFCLRPGMMGWLLINLSVMAKQYEEEGTISLPMGLYQTFTAVYVLDYFWFEEYMTSTWDIIAENFGFMLVLGDLLWIPFTFSLQAWWLLRHPVELSWFFSIFVIILFISGYIVFRGANRQKHIFKHNPKTPIWGKPPKLVGNRLLVSGYWGISRHSNYMGDLMLALSYSLPCGFSSPIPYFYFTYLFILLIWRERRDEERCRAKYKEVWIEYCQKVPWRIFPYIY